MYLIELFSPLKFNDGRRVPRKLFEEVQRTLSAKFGGFTAFGRTPADGAWKRSSGQVKKDLLIIVEVMADTIERGWWKNFKRKLLRDFQQEELVIRASKIRQL